MVAVASCKSKDFPKAPEIVLYQPVFQVKVCVEQQCELKDLCKVWQKQDGNWVKVQDLDIKACHGVFGVNSQNYIDLQDYSRRLESWIGKNCGSDFN